MDLNYKILTNIFIFLKKVCSNIFSIRPKLDNKKYIYFAIWINNIWKKKRCRNIDILESFYYTFICVSIREGKTEYMCAHEILFHWLKFTKLISNKWKYFLYCYVRVFFYSIVYKKNAHNLTREINCTWERNKLNENFKTTLFDWCLYC